ncbi:hypothetical protein C8R43DRAFT_954936 [Mycena crocata]|nr:hypothetical protein C8R43DRAFT_954936 [Mycena crocata]
MTFRNTTCLLVAAACVASPSSPPSIKFDFSLPPPLLFAHASSFSSSPQLCRSRKDMSLDKPRARLVQGWGRGDFFEEVPISSLSEHHLQKFWSSCELGCDVFMTFNNVSNTTAALTPPRKFDSIFGRPPIARAAPFTIKCCRQRVAAIQ